MAQKKFLWLWIVIVLSFAHHAWASDIRVENIKTSFQENYCEVEFDLSWNNSWRISSGPANWDAAWVFFKYRTLDQSGKGQGNWQHATLDTTPRNHRVKNDSNIPAVFIPSEDGKGVFI